MGKPRQVQSSKQVVDLGFECILKAAAAAAKSLQSCPTLCDPIDSSPSGSPVPGILQARVLEWGAIASSDFEGRAPQNTTLHCFPQVGTVCGKENKWPRFEWLTKVGISSGVGGLQAQRTACDRALR